MDAPGCDDVRLLVTELVSNAVRHADVEEDQPLRLTAWLRDATLHIEVWDAGAEGIVAPVAPRVADDVRTGGFGLNLVALLATEWGVQRDADGTTVWLELPTTPAATA